MNVTATIDDTQSARRRLFGFLLAPTLVFALAACDTNDGGMSEEDAAAIRDQIQQVADRLDSVEQRLMDLSSAEQEDEPAVLINEVREVRDDVGEARNMLTEVSQRLADEEAEENIDDAQGDPLGAPAGDPLGAPGGDPLGAPADDGGLGDDLNQLGEDVQEGAQDAGETIQEGAQEAGDAVQDSVDDLGDGANDALDDTSGDDANPNQDSPDMNDPAGNDADDPAPLEDPLVPNAPDL